MTVATRQARRAQETPPSNPFVKYDPVADIPNAQGMLEQEQPAIPGGGPPNQMEQTPPEPVTPPERAPLTANEAFALAKIIDDIGPEGMPIEDYDESMRLLVKFESDNPGVLADMERNTLHAQWSAQNIDSTPHESSRLRQAQQKAQAKQTRMAYGREGIGPSAAAKQFPIPTSLEQLPPPAPGSWDEAIRNEEKDGLDTTTGALGFQEQFNLARKVNGSNAQFRLLYSMAKDNLEQAGIALPSGMHPLKYNENLQQLEMLVPTEDGKVRRVLVEPELMNIASLGKVADVEELMAMTGATLSQMTPKGLSGRTLTRLAQRHPALAEFAGDFGWRNAGIVLEGLLDAEALGGDTGLTDVVDALTGRDQGSMWEVLLGPNTGESASGTIASRIFGRVFQGGGNRGRKNINETIEADMRTGSTEAEAVARQRERIDSNIQEAADTLEELQRLTDVPVTFDRGQISDSAVEIATQRGRTERLTPEEKVDMEVIRKRNWEAFEDATESVHASRITNPDKNAEVMVEELSALERSGVEAAGDIGFTRIPTGTGERLVFGWNQGTGHTSLRGKLGARGDKLDGYGSELEGARAGAKVEIDRDNKEIMITYLMADEAFPDAAPLMLERILEEVTPYLNSNYRLLGDMQITQYSAAMIRSLEDAGVVMAPGRRLVATDAGEVTWIRSAEGDPTFEVLQIPGTSFTRVPMEKEVVPFDEVRLGSMLENDLAQLETLKNWSEVYDASLYANIGFNRETGRSTYQVFNPKNSKLVKIANELLANVEEGLSGAQVAREDALLGAMFVKSADEEGYPVLQGLVEEQLDAGQLLRSRAVLKDVYERTSDPRVKEVYDAVNDLLYDGKWMWKGKEVDLGTRAMVGNSLSRADKAAEDLVTKQSMIESSHLFKRNAEGELVHTTLKDFGSLMSTNNKFFKHIDPWIKAAPENFDNMRSVLFELYNKEVLEKGWTAASHRSFFNKYDTAVNKLLSPDEANNLRNVHFTSGGENPIVARADHYRRRNMALSAYGTMEPGNLLGSISRISTGVDRAAGIPLPKNPIKRVRAYLNNVRALSEQSYRDLQDNSLREVQNRMQKLFFGPDAKADPTKQVKQFREWLDKPLTQGGASNKEILRELHGDQYVTDLEAIWRGMHMDVRRFKMQGSSPLLQGDIIRTSRTLMGPLNVWQRRVSASNWVRLRLHAKRALDVMSDPAKVRELQAHKGYPVRSRPGMAVLARIGILPYTGWDGEGEMPDDAYQKGLAFIEWLDGLRDEDAE